MVSQKESSIERQFDIAEKTINKLSKELHLPFLEIKLYKRFFVDLRDKEHLNATLLIMNTMLEHKRSTLLVLEAIEEREKVLQEFKELAYAYSRNNVSSVDVQAQAFQLLYSLRQATLKVVELIVVWRERLTRPYPFIWNGINYMLRILGDCQFIDSSELSKVLPLQLTTHPLCSNLSSLSLFGGAANFPLKKKYTTGSEEQPRLQRVETALYEEHGMQTRLLRELSAMATGGAFIPLLNLTSLIPNCSTGVQLTNKSWDQRYNQSLRKATHNLMKTTVLHEPTPPAAATTNYQPTSPSSEGF
eukprot:TRINITY_DN11970_c0_g1_i1.p1 TRINITY_DN11970_c0_g1~~TRINITY_DN11970_c0_g1_i1.p1  ORF type:complete len:303 (+),score=99.24 TRINITY_DN11970_c0_g1_i1:733-1641(+)